MFSDPIQAFSLLVVGGRQVCWPHAADLLRAPDENLEDLKHVA